MVERDTTEDVDWGAVAELIAAVGWGHQEPAELAVAFGRSTHVMFVYEGGVLVGCGRTVGDGRYYASIVDVVVRPDRQGCGVGRRIVERLQGQLSGYRLVTLTAAEPVQGFYERLGWRRQRTAMLLPRDREQERLNCVGEESGTGGS
jgi:aralkylamine N-acetyltransferase